MTIPFSSIILEDFSSSKPPVIQSYTKVKINIEIVYVHNYFMDFLTIEKKTEKTLHYQKNLVLIFLQLFTFCFSF